LFSCCPGTATQHLQSRWYFMYPILLIFNAQPKLLAALTSIGIHVLQWIWYHIPWDLSATGRGWRFVVWRFEIGNEPLNARPLRAIRLPLQILALNFYGLSGHTHGGGTLPGLILLLPRTKKIRQYPRSMRHGYHSYKELLKWCGVGNGRGVLPGKASYGKW